MRYDLSGLDQRTVAEAFRYLDLDDSGYIGVSELRHVLTVLAESPLDEELDMVRMRKLTWDSRTRGQESARVTREPGGSCDSLS